MSSTKKKRTVQLGPLLEVAIKKQGLALPETENEIAALEAQFEREGTLAFPARLLVPPDFRPSAESKFRLRRRPVVDANTAEEMARAARGGGAIPTEVEERMARDRAAAEPQQGSDDDDEKD
jgi:hypothetical protein